jgi:AAA domain-containing protein
VPELLLVSTTQGIDVRDLVRALERQAPEGVTVRSAPGLLAPRREGDGLVRDAARSRGATVVVVAPGGPDVANHALLTVEGARSVGLPVAAVVVAGPGGADQRAVLREHAGAAEVVDLPDLQVPSSAVAGWPLSSWAAAEPAPAEGASGDVALAPYSAWEPRPVPDPRAAGRGVIDPVLAEIVGAEGPILASRAYALYNKASGGKKLTSIARAPLSSAAYRLRMAGRIEIVPADEGVQGEEVLRPAGSPAVRVRELGPRALDEVPLDEVAELMDRLATAGADDLKRAVLDAYGLVRLTAKADEYLERALDVAGGA